MRYLGGKSRLGGRIVQAILDDLGVQRLTLAVDLCSGAGGVTHRLADVSDKVFAVEAHPGLVALMRAVQGGWVPPTAVTREEYKASFALPYLVPTDLQRSTGRVAAEVWPLDCVQGVYSAPNVRMGFRLCGTQQKSLLP